MTAKTDRRRAGRPMRETVRTIATAYDRGMRIRLKSCPDPGTISEVRFHEGRVQYRADWDYTPLDLGWYDEDDVQLFEPGDDE